MDLESTERWWREEAETQSPQLDEVSVMRMLTKRATDLRREVGRRLRREAGYYTPMIAISAASLVGGFTFNRVLAACCIVLMPGAVVATLWWAERRIEDAPLDCSLHEALVDLRRKLEAAGRAYVAVYLTLFVSGSIALVAFVWWRHGVGRLFAGAAVLGALAVMWSHRSGRGYVEQMFRRYRAELTECLRQLDEQV
jgi:hypothetical protein